MTWYPVKVALEKGFFRSEGVEPQLIQMNGNVATVALANGYIDFSLNISPGAQRRDAGLGDKTRRSAKFASAVRPCGSDLEINRAERSQREKCSP